MRMTASSTYYFFLTLLTIASGSRLWRFSRVIYILLRLLRLLAAPPVCAWDHWFGWDWMSRRFLMYLTHVLIPLHMVPALNGLIIILHTREFFIPSKLCLKLNSHYIHWYCRSLP